MSLFKNEARRERSRLNTADGEAMGEAMGEAHTTRPMPDARDDAAAQAQTPHEPPRAELRRAAEGRAAMRDREVEDAVVVSDGVRGGQPSTLKGDRGQRLDPIFSADVAQNFRTRWDTTQFGFVDDPRQAVHQADELVAELMKTVAQSFADERSQLGAQTNDTASTETLRVALQGYRSFFRRLLSL